MKITLEINKLTEFERIMATLKEVFDAAKNQQNAIVAALGVFNGLIAEMKELLAANNIEGAQELLDQINDNSAALVAATMEGTPLADVVTLDEIQAAADSVENANAPIDGSAIV